MNFASQIRSFPRPFRKERADDSLKNAPWAKGEIAILLSGTAGCSPYLAGLIAKESTWLESALDDPDNALCDVWSTMRKTALSDLPSVLRQSKRRVALLVALADVSGVWPLEKVTGAISEFAGIAVDCTVKALVRDAIEKGQFPSLCADDAEAAGGLVALAMGKMGAGELNYSSDIDLICLFDDSRFEDADVQEARASFIKITRKLTGILSEINSEGYVFRTDLRLRPDPSVTPVCISMDAAERYYEAEGRTWERAAFIKAAASAGDIQAGNAFLERLTPFVWRKHLDFAAIEDAHDMRLRIRDHKGLGGPLTLDGHNMKLGRGGIREIEFFAQTRQLIAGGRDVSLRNRGTVPALSALAEAGWIEASVSETLTDHYRYHRTIEHRLQMINDAQTHDLPADEDGFERLACFLDTDVAALKSDLTRRLTEVHDLTERFFAPTEPEANVSQDPDWGCEITDQWARYPALKSPRAMAVFNRLWPDIRAKLLDAPKPDEALLQFDGFLSGLPAGVQLFSLFEANPQLTQLIVDIVATAPALSRYLSRHSGVLDAVLGGSFFNDWPGLDALTAELAKTLNEAPDYEAKLTAARKWQAEKHFQIGVHQLRGLVDAQTSALEYAELAEAVVAALWPVVADEFASKHGQVPGQGAAVVAMGSLGAGRLNAVSDLDLIVIYEADGVESSDGRRPLATRTYYARLTQALITALTAQMADGRLYEVDMRLRPSGRQGPVATSVSAFEDYQHNEAWTWEHLALTRARFVCGPPQLGAKITKIRDAVLRAKGGGAEVLVNVQEMRERLAEAKPAQSVWDMRSGEGRLQDQELFAQTAALCAAPGLAGDIPTNFGEQLSAGVAAGWLNDADSAAILDTNRFLWRIHAAARLLTGTVFDPEAVGTQGRDFVMRAANCDDLETLEVEVARRVGVAAKPIGIRLGGL